MYVLNYYQKIFVLLSCANVSLHSMELSCYGRCYKLLHGLAYLLRNTWTTNISSFKTLLILFFKNMVHGRYSHHSCLMRAFKCISLLFLMFSKRCLLIFSCFYVQSLARVSDDQDLACSFLLKDGYFIEKLFDSIIDSDCSRRISRVILLTLWFFFFFCKTAYEGTFVSVYSNLWLLSQNIETYAILLARLSKAMAFHKLIAIPSPTKKVYHKRYICWRDIYQVDVIWRKKNVVSLSGHTRKEISLCIPWYVLW